MQIRHPKHSFLAYRALARPSLPADYESAITDLVEEILTDQWSPSDLDVDGSPLLSLLMFDWPPPQGERKKEYGLVCPPLPGEPLEVSEKVLGERFSSAKGQSAPWKAWILEQQLEKGGDRPKPPF